MRVPLHHHHRLPAAQFLQGPPVGLVGALPDCVLCAPERHAEAVQSNGSVFALREAHPVAADRDLVIPRRHVADYFEMTEQERSETNEFLQVLRNQIQNADATVTDFNVGVNCGETAGQTVMHAHIHLIP